MNSNINFNKQSMGPPSSRTSLPLHTNKPLAPQEKTKRVFDNIRQGNEDSPNKKTSYSQDYRSNDELKMKSIRDSIEIVTFLTQDEFLSMVKNIQKIAESNLVIKSNNKLKHLVTYKKDLLDNCMKIAQIFSRLFKQNVHAIPSDVYKIYFESLFTIYLDSKKTKDDQDLSWIFHSASAAHQRMPMTSLNEVGHNAYGRLLLSNGFEHLQGTDRYKNLEVVSNTCENLIDDMNKNNITLSRPFLMDMVTTYSYTIKNSNNLKNTEKNQLWENRILPMLKKLDSNTDIAENESLKRIERGYQNLMNYFIHTENAPNIIDLIQYTEKLNFLMDIPFLKMVFNVLIKNNQNEALKFYCKTLGNLSFSEFDINDEKKLLKNELLLLVNYVSQVSPTDIINFCSQLNQNVPNFKIANSALFATVFENISNCLKQKIEINEKKVFDLSKLIQTKSISYKDELQNYTQEIEELKNEEENITKTAKNLDIQIESIVIHCNTLKLKINKCEAILNNLNQRTFTESDAFALSIQKLDSQKAINRHHLEKNTLDTTLEFSKKQLKLTHIELKLTNKYISLYMFEIQKIELKKRTACSSLENEKKNLIEQISLQRQGHTDFINSCLKAL